MSNIIDDFYEKWCKTTKRSGGVLIGSSIKQLLRDFVDYQTIYNTIQAEENDPNYLNKLGQIVGILKDEKTEE